MHTAGTLSKSAREHRSPLDFQASLDKELRSRVSGSCAEAWGEQVG